MHDRTILPRSEPFVSPRVLALPHLCRPARIRCGQRTVDSPGGTTWGAVTTTTRGERGEQGGEEPERGRTGDATAGVPTASWRRKDPHGRHGTMSSLGTSTTTLDTWRPTIAIAAGALLLGLVAGPLLNGTHQPGIARAATDDATP